MPVSVTCECGAAYSLKDEYGGKSVKCRQCGATIEVPMSFAPLLEEEDPAFGRDRFLLRQQHLALTRQKYYVTDEDGNAILYVERPHHLMRQLLAIFAAIVSFVVVATVFGVLAALVEIPVLEVLFVLLAIFGALAAAFTMGILCIKKRHVLFYRDDTRQEQVLDVMQHAKFHLLTGTYTVRDADENPLAVLRKHYVYNLFRKRWYCYKPSGELWCIAKEDSLILSLLRRFLGSFLGLLRTNFIITDPETGDVLGEFNRKFTILDRYVLDMSEDPTRKIDRRVAVALGVMLDTGERR